MNTKILFYVSLLVMTVSIFGCGSNEPSVESWQNAEQEMEQNEEMVEQEVAVSPNNMMKKCAGGDEPSYLIYLTSDEAYQRVSMGGGATKQLVTKYQSCVVAEPSEVGPQCVELSASEYADNYGVIEAMTKNPTASMFGIKCSDVAYDAEMFELE